MTLLSEKEMQTFWTMIGTGRYKEAMKYGEKLLEKDYRDGAGIRFGVMDSYAVLGETEKAIQYQKDFLAYSKGMKWKEYEKNMKSEGPDDWIKDSDLLTKYQLGMCFWKAKNYEAAKMCLSSCPALDEYVKLTELELARARIPTNPYGVQMGTLQQMACFINIPVALRRKFDQWIEKEVLPEWKKPSWQK